MTVDKLGARIRRFREFREMSREELAENAGLPLQTIEALEEENLYASIGPLQKVARALKARLGTFMDDVQCHDPIIVRAEQRDTDLSMQKARSKSASYSYHSLGKGKTDRNMEPFFIDIMPDNEEVAFSSHQGEEFIIVVSGHLKIIYGKEDHILGPGDTAYYNSIVPHYVGAANGEPCSIYAVMYYP
jgi:transcriptional regulator with XRE-family HTH domain